MVFYQNINLNYQCITKWVLTTYLFKIQFEVIQNE